MEALLLKNFYKFPLVLQNEWEYYTLSIVNCANFKVLEVLFLLELFHGSKLFIDFEKDISLTTLSFRVKHLNLLLFITLTYYWNTQQQQFSEAFFEWLELFYSVGSFFQFSIKRVLCNI